MTEKKRDVVIVSPLSGTVTALENVPDPVFAEKMMGEGVAILPSDGKIYAPISGTVATIAPTKHAIGFKGDNGEEILIHFGLETVNLKGEPFELAVQAGDRVMAGQLVAEADMKLLKEKNVDAITPVIVCGLPANHKVNVAAKDEIKAGDKLLTLSEEVEETKTADPEKEAKIIKKEEKKKKRKFKINFDFLQKFGKVLMVVIAVMPAAGLCISLGKLVEMAGADISLIYTIGAVMENIGWAIINNLNLLFCIAIGGSWAKERAGALLRQPLLSFSSTTLPDRFSV